MKSLVVSLLALAGTTAAHYTFPALVVGGKATNNWEYVRQTANYQSNGAFFHTTPTTHSLTLPSSSTHGKQRTLLTPHQAP